MKGSSNKPSRKPYPKIKTIDDSDVAKHEDQRPELSRDNNVIRCGRPGRENLKEDLETYCIPEECEYYFNCQSSYMNWYVKIPFFIIDNLTRNLSRSAFKIFIYICRRANFKKHSNHYSRCWLTMNEINEATGVKSSNMRKYVLELEEKGMIKCDILRKYNNKGFATIHQFTVHHIKMLDDKREVTDKLIKRSKAKETDD